MSARADSPSTRGRCVLAAVSLALLAIFSAWRIWSLNTTYPPPIERYAAEGESLEFDGIMFTLADWTWSDGTSIKRLLPDYVLLTGKDGDEYPPEEIRIAYVTISLSNASTEERSFDLTDMSFESGAWGSQWDLEVYTALNGSSQMQFDLAPGQETQVILPLFFVREQFVGSQWEDFETRAFRAVLSNYPEKVYLLHEGHA